MSLISAMALGADCQALARIRAVAPAAGPRPTGRAGRHARRDHSLTEIEA
jgi:hypothetical protein